MWSQGDTFNVVQQHSHGLTGEIFAIAPITLVLSIFVPQSKPSRRCFQRFKRDSTHLKVVAPVQLKCFAVTPLRPEHASRGTSPTYSTVICISRKTASDAFKRTREYSPVI